jgi:hypothetical protein
MGSDDPSNRSGSASSRRSTSIGASTAAPRLQWWAWVLRGAGFALTLGVVPWVIGGGPRC